MVLNKITDSLYGELSLASDSSDGGMSADVLKTKSFRTRARIRMARFVVSAWPEATERLLVTPYTRKGYEVIGYGFQSTVIKSDNEVMKIMRRSTDKSDAWRKSVVGDFSERQQVATEYIGDFLVPQRFAVEPHPLLRGKEVIVARQPLLSYRTLNDDTSQVPEVVGEQLRTFAEASLTMSSEKQLVPDILGAQNLVIQEAGLALLDTVPTRRSENSAGFDKAVALLTEIAKSVAS